MKKLCFGLPVLLLLALVVVPRPAVFGETRDDGRVGTVLDMQGSAMVSPAGHDRWTPLSARSLLMPGDRVRTLQRGANAVEVGIVGGGKLVLGPGTIAELVSRTEVKLLRGEAEVRSGEDSELEVTTPEPGFSAEEDPAFLRVSGRELEIREKPFRWLVGYRASTTDEWMGSLVAEVDGRNTPLTIGYHKVSVVIRDQIAETTVEESFVNSTSATLEGTFTFPLPSDASISGFGMWIGNELVMADIVERQKARAIYEDILRRRKDPGLLEWSGGNLFKARVFPIFPHSEKRVKIRYTQVLPLAGSTLRYRYNLRSEMLRSNPLRALSIRVRMMSTLPVEDAGSPSHLVATEATGNEVRLSYDAEEVTPEKDFEAEFKLGGVKPLTVIPHRRGPDGYFALLLAPPDPSAGGLTRELAPEGDPVDLILLADTSGSMSPADRETQALFLESLLALLGKKDTFRLGAVDRGVTWFREEAIPVTERATADALAFLAGRDSLGWTELTRAVSEAAGRASPKTHVVLLGDGIGTAGDPDPAGLIRAIERLGGKAPGTWHAVSTGSSYEARVLETIARIGGGSVREAASDPAGAAYAFLAEAAAPTVKDLEVSFTGVRTARVYPEVLPNLPAGKQQIVLGRYLPGEEAARGTVVVTGTLNGKEVRYTAPFALAADEEGNSFLPRLWASRHVDALLADASTPEVKEEIVSFSAEFGIMTPLSSFLVLESDADREFYGVERRVAMRDGERFFAEAKEKVDTKLLQKAMRAAGLWRKQLRIQALAEIGQLGRELYPVGVGYGYPQPTSGPIGIGGGAGGSYRGRLGAKSGAERGLPIEQEERVLEDPVIKDAKVADHNETDNDLPFEESMGGDDSFSDAPFDGPSAEVPPGQRDPRSPPPPAGPAASSPRPGRAREMSAGEELSRLDAFAGRGGRRSLRERQQFGQGFRDLAKSRAEDREAREQQGLRQVFSLFPGLAEPPQVPEESAELPDWPEEVIRILEKLDRSEEIDALATGLRIHEVQTGFHPLRDTVSTPSKTRSLVSPDRWIVRRETRRALPIVEWCGATNRSIFREGVQLGRTRPAADTDRLLRLTVHALFPMNYLNSYRGWKASLASHDEESVTIRFETANGNQSMEVRIDTELFVPLTWTNRQNGKVTGKTEWREWTFVAGLPFANLTESYDGEGRLTWRTEVTASEIAASEVAKAVESQAVATADGIFVPPTAPSLEDAKQAAADGEADFVDRLVILADHASRQHWDETHAEWAKAAKLVEGKPGAEWLHAMLLSFSRSGAELKPKLEAMAADLADADPAVIAGLAELIYGHAGSVFGGNELLGLARTLRAALSRTDEAEFWTTQYDRRIASLLESVGRRDEALAIRERLCAESPDDPDLLRERVQALLQTNRRAEAIAALTQALPRNAKWNENEASRVYQQLADLLWQERRLTDFLRVVEEWLERQPSREDAWQRRYVAWLYLGRIEEMDRDVIEVLATLPGEAPAPGETARLGAAISMALGNAWNYNAPRLFPRFWKPLGDAAQRLSRREDPVRNYAGRILSHWRFQQTDEYARLIAALRIELFDPNRIPDISVDRLLWLAGYIDFAPAHTPEEDFALLAGEIEKRRLAEEDENVRRRLGDFLVNLYDRRGDAKAAADVLRRRLDEETADYRPNLASQLLNRLLRMDWTAEIEAEIFDLLPALVHPDWKPEQKSAAFANAAREVADGLERMRYAAAMGPVAEREKLSRAELKQRSLDAKAAGIDGLREVFAERAAAGPKPAAPWLGLESMVFAARGSDDARTVEAALREALLSPPSLPHEYLAWVFETRVLVCLDYLALKREDAEGLADRVLALHRERAEAAEDEAEKEEERYRWFRFLVAEDRPAEIEALLREWIEPEKVASGFRKALAYLLAERGALEKAAHEFEAIAAKDELDAAGFQTLADWYLALGEDERYARAKERFYDQLPEWQLGQRINQEHYRVRNPGPDGVPPDFDPEILIVERILLRKASYPANYLGQIRNLYEATKEFRLLAAVAEGITGHTPEAIYPYLTQCWNILRNVHEEATLDELAAAIREVTKTAETGPDRRGLLYLTALVERRAAEVKNRPELHGDKALPALKAAFPDQGEWLPGEPRLLAEFLASMGRIPVEPLAGEQLRQLGLIHGEANLETQDGLVIAWAYARTLWGYTRHDDAIGILTDALDAMRSANGGRLASGYLNYLTSLVDWHEALSRYATGERILIAERERQPGENEQGRLTLRLFELYRKALAARAEVSLGGGRELYEAAFALIEDAMVTLPAGYVDETVNALCQLCRTAHQRRSGRLEGVAGDLTAFARGRLRKVLDRTPDREQNLWLRVADTIHDVGEPVTGLALLVEKLESDPEWYERVGRDGWSQFAYSMARWRHENRVPAELSGRILRIVLPRLEESLVTGENHGNYFWHNNNSWFWREKANDFAVVARKTAEIHMDSPAILFRVASYFWDGLDRRAEAVDVLLDLDERQPLAEGLRFRLGLWLQELSRHEEAAHHLEILLAANADHLNARCRLAISYHALKRDGAGRKLLADGESRLKVQDRWNQGPMNSLADTAFHCEYWDLGARFYEELVRIYERFRRANPNYAGQLAWHYGRLARCLVNLGKVDEAVKAASSAVVVFGRSHTQRQNALNDLRRVLADIPDLDGYVKRYEAEVAETGLDAPVIRKSLGLVWLERKEWKKAEAQFRAARELSPMDPEIHHGLIAALDGRGATDEAIAALRESIRSDPSNLSLIRDLGTRLAEEGRKEEAERAFTTFVEREPFEAAGHRWLAERWKSERRYDDALVQRRIARDLRAYDPAVWFELVDTLRAADRDEEAREVLTEMIARDWRPEFENTKRRAADLLKK